MSRFPDNVDVRYSVIPVAGQDSATPPAAGTELDGEAVDLQSITGVRYRRAMVTFPYSYEAEVTGLPTVTFASNLQDRQTTSGTGSTWADFGTAPSNHTSAQAGSSGATGTILATFKYEQDLTLVRRYLRVQVTPVFSATTTGGALNYSNAVVLMDPNHYPADTAPS